MDQEYTKAEYLTDLRKSLKELDNWVWERDPRGKGPRNTEFLTNEKTRAYHAKIRPLLVLIIDLFEVSISEEDLKCLK